jgi:two-component system alkaline phosphatase synthesis response regulator PhoP
MKKTIYIIEDDPALQELYVYSLRKNFFCHCFNDGAAFFNLLETGGKLLSLHADEKQSLVWPDLVLLDIMLPGEGGFNILTHLKANAHTAHIPVVIISAYSDEKVKARGLDMGADDYIAKPFSMTELTERINANLIKKLFSRDTIYKDVMVIYAKQQIFMNYKPVKTTLKEYKLICILCENAEKMQEREEILKEVWGDDFIGEIQTLDIHIRGLRKKLAISESKVSIQAIRGTGYILV